MAKNGFLDILQAKLEKNFTYDFEINWDKRNFAVEVFFLLEAANPDHIAIADSNDVESDDNILYEDAVIFYNPVKSKFDEADYLTAISYPPQGLSAEFLDYFAKFLQETADNGLDDLMDFLASDEEIFSVKFDQKSFDDGREKLEETDFHKYPRY